MAIGRVWLLVAKGDATMDDTAEKNKGKIAEDRHDSGNVVRVSADPPNISAAERSEKVNKLAGAIMHAMRKHGEVHIRAFGMPASYKAFKACIVARTIGTSNGYEIWYAPYFISATMGASERTGIGILAVASGAPRQS